MLSKGMVGCGLLLASIVSSFVWAVEDKIEDSVVFISEQDLAMQAAISQAQATLDNFFAAEANPPQGADDFRLKVLMRDAKDNAEHLWFMPFKEVEGGFTGVLANDPHWLTYLEYGQVYAFTREQITDWGYRLDGEQQGSFTICVLFETMDEQVVNQYKDDHGFVCEE
ncbi:YegJ family protein [Thaumasiovibrio subtropicus]|uniref:YegJ family protein n=1 Tax=Thaumasiovibrio subtropicus TaxID=1891207 RepID=UPI000B352E16|nr:DUF2314 domain-containing protein [Thaumasiovibrio subtropicus]